tara:strand:+ start:3109 stop:3291 length:183 start_codon:yes stop_codon:yes gene_type:complete
MENQTQLEEILLMEVIDVNDISINYAEQFEELVTDYIMIAGFSEEDAMAAAENTLKADTF